MLRVTIAFLLCVAAMLRLDAQTLYGSIVGTVTDQSGAVIPNAQVKASSPATGEVRESTTDQSGRYTIGNVIAGTYDLSVSAPGFRLFTQKDVAATVNTVSRVDVQLEVGAQTQEITVASAAALLQTDKSDVHSEFSPKEVSTLPLPNYRNYQIKH